MYSTLASIKSNKITEQIEQLPEPDSTTSLLDKEPTTTGFSLGQEVLVKRFDDKEKIEKFFFGTIVQVDTSQEKCSVKFGDNTDHWAAFKDLTRLCTPEQEDLLLCVVCKKSSPKSKREVISCDKCGRGYHKKCHQPEIPAVCQKNDANWMCCRCLRNEPKKLRKSEVFSRRDSLRSVTLSNTDSQNVSSVYNSTKMLPYELSTLTWDTYHRVNVEQIYCYCGKTGEWYRQMLQCGRCRQWFHENCIQSLQYPLFCGDRFYVFVCSICNHGMEFLRRLEMKWDDFVHLMLYNLTVHHTKKYYDLDSVIIPYINDNWHILQLSAKIFAVNKMERRNHILAVLTNNRNRFKCGREIKKRTTIWGLRVRLPPPVPCLSLPPTGQITETDLRVLWQGNKRLQMMPISANNEGVLQQKRLISSDNRIRQLMSGLAYQKSNGAPSESDSPGDEEQPPGDNNMNLGNYIGAGCVKKSVPFPKMSLQKKKRLLAMSSQRERALRKSKRRKSESNNENDGSNKGRSGAAYLTRLSLDSAKTNNNKCNESLPPTPPPTSVSAPPTPPASGSSNSMVSDLSNDCLDNNRELNAQCDTSGDETSSKSTLDLIIPPPKDFEGKNNPFLALLRGSNADDGKKRRSKDSITLPLPLTAVIPPGRQQLLRPTKRKLSEKDIIIGPNGEVKRKRFRRTKTGSGYVQTVGQTASKTAAVVPLKSDKDWNTVASCSNQSDSSSFFGGRRLRQRPEKPVEKEKSSNPPTPKPSPVKTEPDISIDDLKTSVNIYFGAANRIAAGERFTVKAKRYSPSGKVEYLIEWDGPNTSGLT